LSPNESWPPAIPPRPNSGPQCDRTKWRIRPIHQKTTWRSGFLAESVRGTFSNSGPINSDQWSAAGNHTPLYPSNVRQKYRPTCWREFTRRGTAKGALFRGATVPKPTAQHRTMFGSEVHHGWQVSQERVVNRVNAAGVCAPATHSSRPDSPGHTGHSTTVTRRSRSLLVGESALMRNSQSLGPCPTQPQFHPQQQTMKRYDAPIIINRVDQLEQSGCIGTQLRTNKNRRPARNRAGTTGDAHEACRSVASTS